MVNRDFVYVCVCVHIYIYIYKIYKIAENPKRYTGIDRYPKYCTGGQIDTAVETSWNGPLATTLLLHMVLWEKKIIIKEKEEEDEKTQRNG